MLLNCAEDAQELGCLNPNPIKEFKCLRDNMVWFESQCQPHQPPLPHAACTRSHACVDSMGKLSECLIGPHLFRAPNPSAQLVF